jgi:hypothetical protein
MRQGVICVAVRHSRGALAMNTAGLMPQGDAGEVKEKDSILNGKRSVMICRNAQVSGISRIVSGRGLDF